ncbi:MAG: tetratricopeptide repeat protein [Elusimicrobia bacterium]|nr:tetratricopeptide repeat protein [Candidatus Liberimonas magnetica]
MENYLETGKAFTLEKNYKKALMNFKKALAVDPGQKCVHFEIGKIYYEEHKYDLAIDEFLKETEINPKFILPYLLMGKAYVSKGEFKKALSRFRKAKGLSRGDKETEEIAPYEMGHVYLSLKEYGPGIKELKTVLKLNPIHLNAHLLLVNAYRNKGMDQEALRQLEEAGEINKKDKEAQGQIHYERGLIYYGQEKYDLSVIELEKALESNPCHVNAQLLLAVLYKNKNRYEEALILLEKAEETSNGNKEIDNRVHYEKGQIYFSQKKYGLSIEELKRAVELDPSHINARLLLAIVYENHGLYEDALIQLDKAAGENKRDKGIKAQEHCERAHVYFKQQRYELSLKELNKALKLDRSNIKARLLLAKIYKDQKNYEEALNEFDILTGLKETDIHTKQEISSLKTEIYIEQNKYNLAGNEIKKALVPDDKNGLYHLRLSKFYRLTQEYDKAINELNKVIISEARGRNTDAEMFDQILQLARQCNLSGDRAKAVQISENALNLDLSDHLPIKNALTNEIEIAQNKTKISSKIRNLSVTLTHKCNLNCKMCVVNRSSGQEISQKVKIEVIKALPYLERVSWTGGEVFLYPGFNELLDEAIKYSTKQTITTNGMLLDANKITKIIKNNIRLTISIDGITKAVYENIRQGAKYDLLIDKLNMINKIKKEINPKYRIAINVVVVKSNYHQLEKFVEFAKKYDIFSINLLTSFMKNREDISRLDSSTLSDIVKSIKNVKELCRKYNISYTNNSPDNLLVSNTGIIETDHHAVTGNLPEPDQAFKCYAPWKCLTVAVDGSVKPTTHCFCKKIIGDLNEESLEDIWNGRKIVKYRKSILSGAMAKYCNLNKIYKKFPFELLDY